MEWQTTKDIPIQRRNRSGKGHKVRNREYHRATKHVGRPWLAIDGEGYTPEGTDTHLYYEFSCLSSVAKE
ncbi:MAG: hypothetical protein KDA17_05555, partial [Candidatus Saccharibacteria bacterium]|nr:hypothetical protein [Candidatus Saccharibacteria bacterium]